MIFHNKQPTEEPVAPEEEIQLTEEEEAIVAYLKDEDALPNEILDKVLLQFWNKEPFKFDNKVIYIIVWYN